MTKTGLFVRLQAKPGMQDELAKFLTDALALANKEPGTMNWFAVKFDEFTYGIFDTFPSDTERNAHLNGDIAKSLMENASRLLVQTPKIEKIDVIANKN